MKTLYIFLILALTQSVTGQNITNAGFENWLNIGGWYENPVGWQTNNNQLLVPVIKGSPHIGNFSMQVNQNGWAKTGFSLSQKPVNIQCYVKSNIQTGDSIIVRALIFFSGSVVDSGRWVNTIALPNWSLAIINVSQTSPVIDSIEIKVTGGKQTGTSVSLDDFSYTVTGINEYSEEPGCIVFPVPANGGITFNFKNSNRQNHTLVIIDCKGEVVHVINNIHENKVGMLTTHLSPGVYYYRLQEEGSLKGSGKIIID